jgi:hypothetical protein
MADNTLLNAGTGGDTIASDDVGGIKHQRVKRSLGRDGTAVDVSTAARLVSAAAANQDSTVIKASAGVLYNSLSMTNINAAVRYVKVYNKATGPTSADTPVWTFAVPGNTAGAGMVIPLPDGVDFSAGIALRATTGAADNDANAVAANEVIVNLSYV